MEFFPDSLEELQSYLPLWWRKEDPSSELYKWLLTIAGQIDGTSQAFETAYNNAILSRADRASLIANWAWLWGLDNETLPPTVDALVGFIQSRAQEDGTLQSFIRSLSLLIARPANVQGTQLVFGGHYAQAVLDKLNSCVSYWRLGESAAADSADSNPGTYTGGVTFGVAGALSGDADTAVSLNGTDGYVNVPHRANLAITGDLTLEAWVKPTDYANFNMVITKDAANFPGSYELRLEQGTGVPNVLLGNGTGAFGNLSASTAPATGVWSHIAVVVSGTTVTHYLNGVANGSGSIVVARVDSGTPLKIGARNDLTAGQFFKGSIDEPAIYNTALSAARILAHFTAASTPGAYRAAVLADTPVSYWRLGETFAAADSADSNPGTYTGGVTLGAAGALAGDPDTAVAFNGSTGFVSVPHRANLSLTGDLTLEAWVKPTDYVDYNMILSKVKLSTADIAPYEWRLDVTNGKPDLLVGTTGSFAQVIATTAPATGVWSHIAVVVSGTTVTHYLNGVANGSGSIAGQARGDAGSPLNIGARIATPGNNFFKGSIDEPAIYNTALSAAVIKGHFDAGSGGAFVFPLDGSGIGPLFQSTPFNPNLLFPADGSGLQFPDQALYFDAAGAGLTFDAQGAGLTFPTGPGMTFGGGVTGFFDVLERTPGPYQFTVVSKSYLIFDRNAVMRAIERFRLAHLLPAIYQEVNY